MASSMRERSATLTPTARRPLVSSAPAGIAHAPRWVARACLAMASSTQARSVTMTPSAETPASHSAGWTPAPASVRVPIVMGYPPLLLVRLTPWALWAPASAVHACRAVLALPPAGNLAAAVSSVPWSTEYSCRASRDTAGMTAPARATAAQMSQTSLAGHHVTRVKMTPSAPGTAPLGEAFVAEGVVYAASSAL